MALKFPTTTTTTTLPPFFHATPRQNPNSSPHSLSLTVSNRHRLPLHFFAPNLSLSASALHRIRFVTAHAVQGQELTGDVGIPTSTEDEGEISEVFEEELTQVGNAELVKKSIWTQMKEIIEFTGPATGLWLCGPLMSLIDTAVIGHGSSIELAALGPATVVCDYMSYCFMFLAVATSNMVATALAKQDREEVQHHISVLLFVGLACGLMMLLFTTLFGAAALTAFTGSKNVHVVPAANAYVQIRGLAWPAVLVGCVAQSASPTSEAKGRSRENGFYN